MVKLKSISWGKEDGIELLHETKAVINNDHSSNTKSKFFANKRRRTLENTNESVHKQDGMKCDRTRKTKKPKLSWKIHDLK